MAEKPKQAEPGIPAVNGSSAAAPEITLGDSFLESCKQAVESQRALIYAQIDVDKLLDPEWLRVPENYRAAHVWTKILAEQRQAAFGFMSIQARLGTQILETSERKQEQERKIAELARMLREPRDRG
jgi:hypothetical protein